MKKIFTFIFALMMGLYAMAETVTFTAPDGWETTAGAQSYTVDSITISTTQGVGNVQYRVYKSQTFTVSSMAGHITEVVMKCAASNTTKYGPGCFTDATAGEYTYNDSVGTWTGNALSFTLTASSNQVRMLSIVVTYTPEDDIEIPVDTTGTVHIANTMETAYTTTEAVALINDKKSILTDTVYVQGVIDEIVSVNSKYKSMTYWITDGETRFEVYGGYWLNKDSVESIDVIPMAVGDSVIVKGRITLYNNTTYEFAANNYVVYHKTPSAQWPTDALENNTVTKAVKVLRDGQVLIKKNDEWYDVIGRKIIK